MPSKRRADALVYIGLLYDIDPSKSQFCPNSVLELPFVRLPYDLSSLQCYTLLESAAAPRIWVL